MQGFLLFFFTTINVLHLSLNYALGTENLCYILQ